MKSSCWRVSKHLMHLSRKNDDFKREFRKVFKNAVFLYSYNKQRSLGEARSGCEQQEKPRVILLHSLVSPIVLILLPFTVRSCGCPVQTWGQRGVLRIPQSVAFTRPGSAGIMSHTGPQRGKKMTAGSVALKMLSVYFCSSAFSFTFCCGSHTKGCKIHKTRFSVFQSTLQQHQVLSSNHSPSITTAFSSSQTEEHSTPFIPQSPIIITILDSICMNVILLMPYISEFLWYLSFPGSILFWNVTLYSFHFLQRN